MQPASYRGFARGMQVHAVPESERFVDASGRRLPWAYDAGPAVENREPVERGPFGRSQRRSRSGLSRSRSRTAEPRREEDRLKAEQLAAEDAVFGSLRKVTKDEGRREALGEVDANAVAQATATRDQGEQEATEVLLYGFGEELQWSALDHYERVSGGVILEDYDRQPPGQRYDISRSLRRARSTTSLNKAALKKRNTFAGGLHWIKVTFNSRTAAELACARSPHVIKGYLVSAEPYMGRGPGRDEPRYATQAGAQITDPTHPRTFSTNNIVDLDGSPNGSSATASSATATGQNHRAPQIDDSPTVSSSSSRPPLVTRQPSYPSLQRTHSQGYSSAAQNPATPQQPAHQISQQPSSHMSQRTRRARISGVTPATPLPASLALLPKQPKQSWSVWLGASEVIGSAVPITDDGRFDYGRASLYWRVFWWVDSVLGTDFCGMRGD